MIDLNNIGDLKDAMIPFNSEFQFEICMSRQTYESKKMSKMALSKKTVKIFNQKLDNTSKGLNKMAFDRKLMSIKEFANAATSGYAFCNLFSFNPNQKYIFNPKYPSSYPIYRRGINKGAMKMEAKRDEHFEGGQCFFVDIDYTEFEDIQSFIDKLTFKPTVTYLSYSDNVRKKDHNQSKNPKYDESKGGITSRRFRLCYIFMNIIKGTENYKIIGSAIHNMVQQSTGEKIQDKCGVSPIQYFNGTINKEQYITSYIYLEEDFKEYISSQNDSDVQKTSITNATTIYGKPKIDIFNPPKITRSTYDAECFDNPSLISPKLILRLKRIEDGKDNYDSFMSKNRKYFIKVYRDDNGQWTNAYQIIDDSYFALPFYYSNLKDGMMRRKKLYERMCLRRVICPNITANNILFNAYEDLQKFVDNSDDPITIDDLVRNVNSAFNQSIDTIKEKFSDRIASLKSKAPKGGLIFDLRGCKSTEERNIRMKKSRWSYYDEQYDPNLTVKENADKLKVSVATMRKYCKYRDIKTSTRASDEELMRLINPNISIEKNRLNLKEKHSINVSKDRIAAIIKQLRAKHTITYLYASTNIDASTNMSYINNQVMS